MKNWGQLTSVDLFDCKKDLTSGDCLKDFAANLCSEIGMKLHGEPVIERFGDGAVEGWSLMQFIETSTITVHLDEIGGRVFVDIFSCKNFDGKKAEDFCVGFWRAGRVEGKTVSRG